MNRSTIYHYLMHDTELNVMKMKVGRGKYNCFYTPWDWDYSFLHINGSKIQNFRDIILFSSELVVRFTNLDDWQINIPYNDINYIGVVRDENIGYIGLQDGKKVQRY